MATGSYEGYLPVEGIPDHHEASAFTRRRQRWSRRLPHPPTRSKPSKRGTDGQTVQRARKRARREGETGIATGVSEARSRQHRGKKTPTLVSPGREAVELENSAVRRSAEAVLGRRETSGPPVLPRGAKDSVGCPRGESRESEPGTREVRVHVVRLGGRDRSDASRVFSTGRPQGLLVTREGASREEVRSTA
jgi:hypothetical protein